MTDDRRSQPRQADDSIRRWLDQEATRAKLKVEQIDPSRSAEWLLDEQGCLSHKSGRFFRVIGVEFGAVMEREAQTQPIIDQPEIGTLCFLTAKCEHDWWLLMQAKVEPGNVNAAQLAPTVQATRSNYRAVHGGKAVPYLQLAHEGKPVLYDQLQSEQNSRFLRKRNRNKVVQLDHRIAEAGPDFRWLPLAEILPLLKQNNMVNTDARSVIACWLISMPQILRQIVPATASFGNDLVQSLGAASAEHTTDELDRWLDDLKQGWPLQIQEVSLSDLSPSWHWQAGTLESTSDHVLQLRHIKVDCATREVANWDQPILATRSPGKLTTVIGLIDGVQHLLLQARLEAGNRQGFELTTSIQADSTQDMSEFEQRYWNVFDAKCSRLLHFENSEEGGRFDHCINEYEIFWTDDPHDIEESPFHRWISFGQVANWISRPNRLTNELRSSVSAILSLID